MANEVVANEAARRLRVNDSRVRQLLRAGAMPARKVANRWLVDANALERRASRRIEHGRPFEPENAWALLFLASGEDASWLRSDVRSRLRRRLFEHPLVSDVGRLAKRARVDYYAAGARAREEMARDPRFVRSGVSAAAEYAADIRSPDVLEGYVPEAAARRLVYRLALRPADERKADLILHSVAGFWPFGDRKVAPKAVAAADLLGSLDQRTRRAGEQLIRELS